MTEVQQYIRENINTFIQPLVCQIVQSRPGNPLHFAIQWLTALQTHGNMISKTDLCSELDQYEVHEEQLDKVRQLQNRIQMKKAQHHQSFRNRLGISEEVFGQFNSWKKVVLRQDACISQQQISLVKKTLKGSVLFQNIDQKDQEIICRALTVQQVSQYEMVVKEGEIGTCLYIVQSGEYDCYKMINEENVLIKTYKPGETFGELALMYNAPRAASIVSNLPGKLLVLDRSIFSQILKVAALRKRQLIGKAIDKVEVLKAIPLEMRHQFIGILKEQKFAKDTYVVSEGKQGDKFYIILQGKLVAEKLQNNTVKTVFQYQEGDYFGELALINNAPRKASVKALTQVKLATISRMGFKRVFGEIEETFKELSSQYL